MSLARIMLASGPDMSPSALASLPSLAGNAGAAALLAVEVALLGLAAAGFGRRLRPEGGPRDRWMAGTLVVAAACTLGIRLLGALGALEPAWALGGPPLLALVGQLVGHRVAPRALVGPRSFGGLPAALLGAGAVGTACVAAAWLPVWQWDALGYHLPFVNFALQSGSLDGVPPDAPYLGSYPHSIELLFIGLRLMLPDDRLIDLGQVPLGLIGAGAIAALARRLGAARSEALAAGALWLTLPAVFLQLPTNYVDVGVAAWLLCAIYWVSAPVDRTSVLLAAVALGLFLGSKPGAPLPTAILGGWLALRCHRAGRLPLAVAAGAVVLAIGGESYFVNLWRHHNPVWPVEVKLGPLRLPGPHTMSEVLTSGAKVPRPTGGTLERLVRSWLALEPPRPAFDMKLGGLGPLFTLLALPGALVALRRPSLRPLGVALAATLATPEPSLARYTLALPGVCLALTAVVSSELKWQRALLRVTAPALAVWGFATALPGLTGEGPPLPALARLAPAERDRAVGAEGRPDAWIDAREALAPGEAAAYDDAFELSYLLWRSDLGNRVVRLTGMPRERVAERLVVDHVSLLVAGDGSPAAELAALEPARFHPLFRCRTDACTVYRVEAPHAP